ncbi:hypothetical protein CANARDRAFT_184317, partial [[Candida] arabinofermentans NRRL YB-2248]
GMPGSEVPPRKRSKVSRACDACRRKKIRCDASLNMSNSQVTKLCTNCERGGDICTFTRVPLKRGPTKGYSKGSDDGNSTVNGPSSNRGQVPHVILPPLNSLASQQQKQQQQQQQFQQQQQGQQLGMSTSILPPLQGRARSTSLNSLTSQSQTGQPQSQPMFWKVPYDMPHFDGRRGSVDSISSSISGSFSPSNRASSITGSVPGLVNSPRLRAASGVESVGTSDSEDEFLISNASKLSRNSFQIPITSRSPANSFVKDPTISPAASHTSLNSINQGMARVSFPHSKNSNLLKSIEFNADLYYSKLDSQYPLLPKRQDLIEIIERLDPDQYKTVLEIFNASLQIINSVDLNFDFNTIISHFQQISLLYASKSFIYNNENAKILFLTSLTLLNYAVLLSGHDYSIGLSISFSIFNDWRIFSSDPKLLSFRNLMNLLIFDNIYSLMFGTPRNSDLHARIDDEFIDQYLKSIEFQENESYEYFIIGLHMLQLSRRSNYFERIHEFTEFKVNDHLSDKIKFLKIMRCDSELYMFFKNIEPSFQSMNSAKDTDDLIFELQLRFSKLTKETTNLIDEQLNDFEKIRFNPLLPAIIVKCFKMLKELESLTGSLIKLNKVIQNDDFKTRLPKLLESINTNISRIGVMRAPLPFLRSLIAKFSSRNDEIQFDVNGSPLDVVKSWGSQTANFLAVRAQRDYIDGWYS